MMVIFEKHKEGREVFGSEPNHFKGRMHDWQNYIRVGKERLASIIALAIAIPHHTHFSQKPNLQNLSKLTFFLLVVVLFSYLAVEELARDRDRYRDRDRDIEMLLQGQVIL